MIELSITQQAALDKKNAERGQARFIEQALQAWHQHGKPRTTTPAALDDAALREWIRLSHASCLRHGVPSLPLALEFTFAVLRAVHLGADRAFVSELAGYFFDRAPDHRGSLDWINTVLSQLQLQQMQPNPVIEDA